MKILTPDSCTHSAVEWEYILDDLLEMSCSLGAEERLLLLDALRVQICPNDTVNVHPAFSIGRQSVLVVEEGKIEECWIYYPKGKRIEKYAPVPAKDSKNRETKTQRACCKERV